MTAFKFSTMKVLGVMPVVAIMVAIIAAGCASGSKSSAERQYDTVTTMTGLRYIEYEKGDGPAVTSGMTVRVDYAGFLADGTLFDTSLDSVAKMYDRSGKPFAAYLQGADRSQHYDRGGYPFEPIEFAVGQGNVIRGWDDGITGGMHVGGRRRLIIPSEQAYGRNGRGTIPPNAMLIFDVHIVSVK